MPSLRLMLRRLGAIAWTAIAIIVIVVGVVVGLGRALLPFADHLEPRLEAWLTQELQRSVDIGGIGATWAVTGPEFRLSDVGIHNPDSGRVGARLPRAQVKVNLLAWLSPVHQTMEFRVANTRFALRRDRQGNFSIEGLGGLATAGSGEGVQWLLRQGRISLVDAQVVFTDATTGVRLHFDEVDITLNNRGEQHLITGELQLEAKQGGALYWQVEWLGGGDEPVGSLRFHVRGDEVVLAHWLQKAAPAGIAVTRGVADFRLWGAVNAGQLQRVQGHFQLQDLLLQEVAGADESPAQVAFDALSTRLLWFRTPTGWRLFGEELKVVQSDSSWPESGFTVAFEPGLWRVGADYLNVEDVVRVATLGRLMPQAWVTRLNALAPRGVVRGLAANWRPDARLGHGLALHAELERLGWIAQASWPGVLGVSGHLRVLPGNGLVTLKTPQIRLDYARLFGQELEFSDVLARIAWRETPRGWQLHVPRLHAKSGEAKLLGRLELQFQSDGSRPFIDLRGRVVGGKVTNTRAVWPVGIMPDELVEWLDQALLAGELEQGRVLAFGDLDNWPFDQGKGRFEARGVLHDVTLNYRPGWPPVTEASARLHFEGRGLSVLVDSGVVAGASITSARALVPDLDNARLSASVQATGAAPDLLRFLGASPLQTDYGRYLQGLTASGSARVSSEFFIPLDQEHKELSVNGTVRLDGVQLTDAKWDTQFSALTGLIQFNQDGFHADALEGRFRGEPMTLSLTVGGHAPPGTRAKARLAGIFSPANLLAPYPELRGLAVLLEGESAWKLELTIPAPVADGAAEPSAALRIESDLHGIGVKLPAPLAKAATVRLPFAMEIPLPYAGGVISLHYGERLAVALDPVNADGFRGRLQFGTAQAHLPSVPGLVVGGQCERLDLDAWIELLAVLPTAGDESLLRAIDLSVAELIALNRIFTQINIKAAPENGTWRVTLLGNGIEGSVRLPSEHFRGLVADFKMLVLPQVEDGPPTAGLALDPRLLPPLHLAIDEFTFGDAMLGRTRMEAFPIENGMRIDLLRAENENTAVAADGTWVVTQDGNHLSRFDFIITAESLGNLLTNFGYTGLVEGASTFVRLDASWPGPPSSFSLQRVAGEMRFRIGSGNLVPLDPGAGRVFGLLSLQALPRRLLLDFTDVFEEGLSFDSITGSFQLLSGVATTDDLVLQGPAARIEVDGRVDLVEQTYNQVISVFPSVGVALPVVGGLAAGPPGVAALFLFQTLFKDQIEKAIGYRYLVTGPWSNPQVKLIETPPEEVGPPLKPKLQ